LFLSACRQSTAPETTTLLPETKQHLSPDERYGDLFVDIQMNRVFKDGKTFVDCTPKFSTDEILKRFKLAKATPGFDLKRFVLEHFDEPKKYASGFKSDTSRTAAEHINALWSVLLRQPDASTTGTLIPLPKSYIVPGGRFGEIYYWDSYFTILGLQTAEKWDLIENMADNFAYLIDDIGFIPNGNRRYFSSRSQPPFFSAIIRVLAEGKGDNIYKKYLPQLEKEYQFWMNGMEKLSADAPTHRRVVRLPDGSILNRYFDDNPKPRAESYREDVELAEGVDRKKADLYQDLRAACESGWDFSSRWFSDGQYLASIHTTDIIPVDLNALLYHLEIVLAKAYSLSGNEEQATLFTQKSANRKRAVLQYCWDEKDHFFIDYDFAKRKPTGVLSLAGLYPLFFNLSDQNQAEQVATVVQEKFLKPGGVVTTLNETGQQWDSPNGWAPLQWITIKGLRNYNQIALADTIKKNWVDVNVKVYRNTGKMVEKYNVLDMGLEAGGGEYPVQDGFGWTNGILLRLLMEGEVKKD